MTASCQTRLTDTDKNVLAKAHRLADAHGRQVAEVVGTDTADIALVYAESFGVAQVLCTSWPDRAPAGRCPEEYFARAGPSKRVTTPARR